MGLPLCDLCECQAECGDIAKIAEAIFSKSRIGVTTLGRYKMVYAKYTHPDTKTNHITSTQLCMSDKNLIPNS